MRLVLLSHGSTDAVRTAAFADDEPLDRYGRDGVRDARPALGRVDEVRCAPSLQCRQTAEELGLDPIVDDGLRGPDHGRWAGRRLDDVLATDPDGVRLWTADPAFDGHGGESLADVVRRVGGWLDARVDPPHALLAVCDVAVVRAAVVHALGAPAAGIRRVDVGPTTVAVLVGGPGRWGLRSLGALRG